ncbi:hypothetical protein HMPREF1981_01343 [Bacteroides pyogenes F0041]|uniref:Lipoprotein n=1 Tax=Bacteroides pyogenes F0041 TaxID=1321819 RepID=U2E0K8_9BACE|nr:hypothetical protein [Bacteroides pyogenes]ERI85756.1 hypothetical protein HMPREF1981_01343 [Bacteroides pyogenes F0041]MBB3895537.1 hypothetical protein [Bacteroides pyogenes]GAE21988.1 hypothetical protein JCM10003_1518 [Bacteroides pyogenes JCM 10003]SUV34518.1 Uncharacterised protein [Bacteroides pyogenes]
MRAKNVKYWGIALIAMLAIGLTSCDVEVGTFYDDDNIGGGYYNRSSELCSRTWVSFYIDAEGNRCRQELDFYMNRTGVDFIRVEYPDGYVKELENHFRWNWDNYGQTSLRMVYGPKDVSFLDGIYIGGNRLTGYLDGRDNYVEYRGK